MQAALPSPTYFDLQRNHRDIDAEPLKSTRQACPATVCQLHTMLIASCGLSRTRNPAYLAAILWPRDAYKIIMVTISPADQYATP